MQELSEMEPASQSSSSSAADEVYRPRITLVNFPVLAHFVGYTVIVNHRRPTYLDLHDSVGQPYFSEDYIADDKPVEGSQIGTLVGAERRADYDPKTPYSIRYLVMLSQGNGPALRIPLCEGADIQVMGFSADNQKRILPIDEAHRLSAQMRQK